MAIWGKLSPETEDDRRAVAHIDESDIVRALQFVQRMRDDVAGTVYDLEGEPVTVTGAQAKRYWNGGRTWNAGEASYAGVGDVRVKAVNEAMIQHMRGPMQYVAKRTQREMFPGNLHGNISTLMQRIAFGEIEVEQWYHDMQLAVKYGDMAAVALARGGWSNVTPESFQKSEERVFVQINGDGGKIKGLRKFAESIQKGAYGEDVLTQDAWSRAGLYSNPPRQVYENEHVLARSEVGQSESCRILADATPCRDCINWAALGFISTDTMLSQYPIGASVCRYGCHCRIVTRRPGGATAPRVQKAIEAAQQKAADVELAKAGRLKAA
jgi:hypothetical protein